MSQDSSVSSSVRETHVFAPIFSLDNCEVSWIDEDGDSINVQSSDDLVHALSGMKDTAFIRFDLLESKVLYKSSNFWLLGVDLRDFSQAEKKELLAKLNKFTK